MMSVAEPKCAPRRGGRPSRAQAGKLEDRIFDAAVVLFFSEGYGAVSIEELARRAQISKRTFYARYENKAAVFRAVVQRVIMRLRPSDTATERLFEGRDIREILTHVGTIILQATLTPEALALHRVVLAEATRFPELAMIMHEQSSRQEAINRIAKILQAAAQKEERYGLDPFYAAEQFLLMITVAPQRRAMGLGEPMNQEELKVWITNTIDLFLDGFLSPTR
jgi:AcrR family transcriptional regulator